MDLSKFVRTIPNFPKKGVMFKDITPLLSDGNAFRHATDSMCAHYIRKPFIIDKVVSAESRGFIFGSILANALHAGFVPLRKPGKLPYKTVRKEFRTEYSTDVFEVHEDSILPHEKCIIVDDVIATGGTSRAAVDLVESLGGEVKGLFFLIELDYLKGREKLSGHDIFSLLHYKKE